MGDPLSIAASAAGLVSLGLTVCSGLLDYYNSWKDQPSDITEMCESLEVLGKIFKLLDQKVRHPLLNRESVDRVTESLITCDAGVKRLRSKLEKMRSFKSGLSARLQRAQYPFQQKTIEKLGRTISDLRSNLVLAVNTLHIDVSMTSLDISDRVDKDIKDLTETSKVSSTEIIDSISKVHLVQEQEKLRALNSEERDVLHWLSPLDFFSKQSDALSRRQEGTGRWLLESNEFRSWLETAGKVLWCPGMPGAGKTVLASTVIDYLEQERRREKTGVAYVYCVHNGADQTASNFLGSTLRQLATQSAAILEDIKLCHKHHDYCGTRPSLGEIARLLRSQVEEFEEVFIVIDALDECPERDQTRKLLLTEIRRLLPKISLMVTSRNMPSIEAMFKHDTRLEICAQDQDVKIFINSQLHERDELIDLLEGHRDVRSSIIPTVLEKTNGMFLIAALHMDSLAQEDNIRDLKESLKSLPKDLDKTYDDAFERIKQQDSRKLDRADQILRLISCAKRPLKLEEIRQALSIRRGDTFLDPEAFPKTDSLISTCCGLVIVEDSSQIVRFVHYTTEEYFKRKLQRYCSPEAHGRFAGILITYLSFTKFESFPIEDWIEEVVDEAGDVEFQWTRISRDVVIENFLEHNILLQYAAENWGHHTRDAFMITGDHPESCLATTNSHSGLTDNPWNLKKLVQDFLQKEHNAACANEVFHHTETLLPRLSLDNEFRAPTNVIGLHMAASFGLQYFVEYYLDQGAEVDARDSVGMTALHKAAMYGRVDVVRLLLEFGAAVGIRDQLGYNALVWAVRANEVSVSRLLLQNGSDPEFKTYPNYSSPIAIAARQGHEEILELLTEYGADDAGKHKLIVDAFLDAALNGRNGIVRLLVRNDKSWELSEQDLARAMTKAASRGHVTTMSILLKAGVNVKSPSSLSRESLQEAAKGGHSEATQLLLTAGANPNIQTLDGNLPLHEAARNGHVGIVALLLEHGADVNALNSKGETAIFFIVGPKNEFLADLWTLPATSVPVMQLLLEKGANTAATPRHSSRTSLEYAIFRGHKGLVQLLLQCESLAATQKNLMLYLTDLYDQIREKSGNDEAVNRLLGRKEAQNLGSAPNLLLIPIPAERGYERVVLTFLQAGADIEATNLQGNTALQMSARAGHIAIVRLLLQQGADINSRGSTDATPLIMAAEEEKTDVVSLLLDQGANIDATSGHLLHVVIRYSEWKSAIPIIDLLLEKGADLEAQDHGGQTPLVVAIRSLNFEIVRFLLERGADLEAKDRQGQTPLMVAVQEFPRVAVGLLKFLLENGANLEAKDNNGHTPLVIAVRDGRVGNAEFLLERGADPQALPLDVTVEDEWVSEYHFERAVKVVLEAQSKS